MSNYDEIKNNFANMEVQTEKLCKEMIMDDYKNISLVKNLTEDLILWAMDYYIDNAYNKNDVREVGKIFKLLDDNHKTYEVKKKFVSHYYTAIKHVEQTDEFCELAVTADFETFKFINNPSKELIIKCLKVDPHVLKFIDNQTEEFINIALNSDIRTFCYIDEEKINQNIMDLFIDNFYNGIRIVGRFIHHIPSEFRTKDTFYRLIEKDPNVIKYLEEDEQDEFPDLCLMALREDGLLLKFIKNHTREMDLTAVKSNGLALKFVKEQDEEICIAAIKQNKKAYRLYCRIHTQAVYEAIVKKSGIMIQYVPYNNITEEMVDIAMSKSALAIKYIPLKFIKDEYCVKAVNKKAFLIKDILRKGYRSSILVELLLEAFEKDLYLLDFIHLYPTDEYSIRAIEEFPNVLNLDIAYSDRFKDITNKWKDIYNAHKIIHKN